MIYYVFDLLYLDGYDLRASASWAQEFFCKGICVGGAHPVREALSETEQEMSAKDWGAG
jgi:hypothetical protein